MRKQDHILMQKVADGKVSRNEFNAFQERMRKEPELLVAYRDYSLLHHSLCEEFEGMPLGRLSEFTVTGNAWAVAGGFAAAAALVLLAAVVFLKKKDAAPVSAIAAKLEFSEDAIWSMKGVADGKVRNGEELDLIQGRAELVLATGAVALIEGPAKLRVDNSEEIFLKEGRGFFRLTRKDARLEVATPSLLAVDLGTAFGISASRDKPDELQVTEGKVRLMVGGEQKGADLVAGDGARVDAGAKVERFEVEGNGFAEELGNFRSVIGDRLEKADWRMGKGGMEVKYGTMSGTDFEAYRRVPALENLTKGTVVLASMEVMDPEEGEFHTENWAGMSLFKNGEEILFFGDSFGPEKTWSLDVKQAEPVILPEEYLPDAMMVTMRYEFSTGRVTLHAGGLPLKAPFCTGWLKPGQTFDEVRLGAAPGAAIAVKLAEVRVSD